MQLSKILCVCHQSINGKAINRQFYNLIPQKVCWTQLHSGEWSKNQHSEQPDSILPSLFQIS